MNQQYRDLLNIVEAPLLFKGDLIQSRGEIFRIVKVNRTRYVVENEAGKQYTYPIDMARKAPEGTVFNAAPKAEAETPSLVLGSVVRFKGRGAQKFPGTYVLIRKNGEDRGSFAKLFGDNDRYVRGDFRGVEVVKPEDLELGVEVD